MRQPRERLGLAMEPGAVRRARLIGAHVELRFERLVCDAGWQGSYVELPSKLEDPGVLLDLQAALARVALRPAARVLDLGCNTGELFALLPPDAAIVGVDRSAAALAIARERWPSAQLVEADVTALPPLGRFDLVLSVGLLQSGALDDRELVRHVVQDLATPGGAVIFGWPNCRYIAGEVEFGARMKNFTVPV